MWKISNCFLLTTLLCFDAQFSTVNTSERQCDLRQTKSNTTTECDFKEHDHRLVCFHGLEDKWRSMGTKVRTLVICYWPSETFDPGDTLREFSTLRKLIVERSNLTEFTSPFPSENEWIEKVEVTETRLRKFPERAFVHLSRLKILDLRNNSLQEINVETFDVPSLRHIYFAGNPWKCTDSANWILDREKGTLGDKVVDKESLRCTVPYDGRPLIPVVEIIITLKQECTRTVCECELVYVVGRGGKHIQRETMAFASVNCSHRGLTEMPSFLPAHTTTLHLSGNKIHDLRPLSTNPVYRGVIDLYLDDNRITSIVQLEGSSWMDSFRLLSFRGNQLTDVRITFSVIGNGVTGTETLLPTYALENVLQHNGNAVSLYLGRNPWRCDCLFTLGFQNLLIRYTNLIKDVNDVRCSSANGDDNSGKIIRDLKRTEICVSPDEEPVIHPLDILNIILAILIFLIIGKLLYDYWSFKKTGKLPWIIGKIP